MKKTMKKVTKQKIKEILAGYKKEKIADENLKPSAVLMPLFYDNGSLHVLFTKRSDEVNFHKGQVCFPGGGPEPCDLSLLQTALREAEEEIGLKAKDVELLGELDDNPTRTTGYVISPFVAFIPYPYPFRLDRKEVEEIFSAPLSALMDEVNFREDYYPTGDKSGSGYAYEYEGHIIWGATARILKQFTELLREKGVEP
jgi:8-oxo-dGTP pyrophosphatase MutT (NUDIX family)